MLLSLAQGTFDLLAERIKKQGYGDVSAVHQGCSSAPGKAVLNVYAAGSYNNSITPLNSGAASQEEVELTSIDEYCRLNDIRHVDLVKVDAEGHDFEVMAGARRMLQNRAIGVFQFEYNQTWIGARRYLRDVFVLLEP